jgi:UDP-2,3-diacylglucosamine pyrophosphatase LpxH
MLIVFSDVHLTDESTAHNVHATAFERLGKDILAAAEQKAARELQVLLLGDVLDLVRTGWWHQQEDAGKLSAADRPWNGTLDPATGMNTDVAKVEPQFQQVFKGILRTESCQALLAMLNGLPSLAGRRPAVTYVMGNHDRVLNNFPSLQDLLRRRLSKVDLTFARSFQSDAYGALARHGHEWDVECHGWEFLRKVLARGTAVGRFDEPAYRVMGIGEVITAELMSGLIHRVQGKVDRSSPDDRAFLESLQEVNNLRPFTAVFEWIAWLVRNQGDRYAKYLELLRLALRDSLAATLESSLAKRWDKLKADWLVSGDITDHLSRAYLLVKQRSGLRLLEGLRPVLNLYQSASKLVRPGDGLDALAEGARQEFESVGAAAATTQYVLYGHTHEGRQDCFRGFPDGRAQLYVNTGTFLPFIDRAHDGRGFWTAHRMTYAFLFRDDEDRSGRLGPGPTLDVWDGLRRKRYRP